MLQCAAAGSIQSLAGGCQPMTLIPVDKGLLGLFMQLLPPRCVLCGYRGQVPALDLCLDCEVDLPLEPVALGYGPSPLDRCFAPFAYGFPVDHLVHLLKYHRRLAVGRVLGALLARSVREFGLHLDVDVMLPVPLHPERLAERGFNQSAEIARSAARVLGCRYQERVLRRERLTRPQVGLRPDERRANLADAFRATRDLRGLRVVIVDDVLTTGATACAVAAALLEAGAFSVDAWCVARAAPPERLDWRPASEASPA